MTLDSVSKKVLFSIPNSYHRGGRKSRITAACEIFGRATWTFTWRNASD